LLITDEFTVAEPKTKLLQAKLTEQNLTNVLIVTEALDEKLYLSARNLIGVNVVDASAIDPVSLISYEKVIMTVPAVKLIEESLA
jgi:large subunit ribosomal protein L4